MAELQIDSEQLKVLKDTYNKATSDGRDSFMFQDQEILVSYAKYMIEYLEGRLRKAA